MAFEDFEEVDPAEPVAYEDEAAGDAGIAEAIRRVKRTAMLARTAVVLAAAVVALLVFGHPATLAALGVIAQR